MAYNFWEDWLRRNNAPQQGGAFNLGETLGDLLTKYGQYIPGVGNVITGWERARGNVEQLSDWWRKGTQARKAAQAAEEELLKQRRPGESLAQFRARMGLAPAPAHALYTMQTERGPETEAFDVGDLPMSTMEAIGKGAQAWGKATTWIPWKKPEGETYEQYMESPRATAGYVPLPWQYERTHRGIGPDIRSWWKAGATGEGGKGWRITYPGIAEFLTPDLVFPAGKAPKAEQVVLRILKNLERGVDPNDLRKILTTTTQAGRQYATSEADDLIATAQRQMAVKGRETLGAKGYDVGTAQDMFTGEQKLMRTAPSEAAEQAGARVPQGEQLGLGERVGGGELAPKTTNVGQGYDIMAGGKKVGEITYGDATLFGKPDGIIIGRVDVEASARRAGNGTKAVLEILDEAEKTGKTLYTGMLEPDGVKFFEGLEKKGVISLQKADQPMLGDIITRGKQGIAPAKAVVGKTTKAFGADPAKSYDFQYKLVELEDLVTSHLDNFEVNPKYPAELQPRIRSREMSRVQIDEIANNLEPDALLYDTRQLDTGPMIVGPDNIVESGNGRIMALKRARDAFPENYQKYKDKLKAIAKDMGFTADDVGNMKNPVLVRQRTSEVANRAAFAAEANVPVTMAMSPFEQAVQDASNLSDDVLARLTVGEQQTIEQAIKSSSNSDVLYHFLNSLPDTARAAISDAKGNINMAGIQRLKMALLAKVFSGPSGRRLTEVFIESADPIVKNIENAIYKALPKMVKAESISKIGFTEDVARAVEVFAWLKSKGLETPDYLAQMGMLGDELTDIQKLILAHLDDIGNRPKALREFLTGLSDEILKIPPKGQMAFGGGVEELSKEGIINAVIKRQRKELKQPEIDIAAIAPESKGLEEPAAGGAAKARTMEPPLPRGGRGAEKAIPEQEVKISTYWKGKFGPILKDENAIRETIEQWEDQLSLTEKRLTTLKNKQKVSPDFKSWDVYADDYVDIATRIEEQTAVKEELEEGLKILKNSLKGLTEKGGIVETTAAKVVGKGKKAAKEVVTEAPPEKPLPAPLKKVADQLDDLDSRLNYGLPRATKGLAGPEPKYPWQELPGETLGAPTPGARPTPLTEKPPLPQPTIPQAVKGPPGEPSAYPWQELPGQTLMEPPTGARPTPETTVPPPYQAGPVPQYPAAGRFPHQPAMQLFPQQNLLQGAPPLGQAQPPGRVPPSPRRPPAPPPPPPGAVPVNPQVAAQNPKNWMQKARDTFRLAEKRINDDFARLNKMGSRAAIAQGQPLFRNVSKLEEALAVGRGLSGAIRETLRKAQVRIWDICEGSPQLLDDVGKYWEMRHQLEIMIHHGRMFYIRNVGGRRITINSTIIMRELQAMERRLGIDNMRKVDDATKVLVDTYNQTLMKSHEIAPSLAQHLQQIYPYYCPSIYDDEVVKIIARGNRMSPHTVRALSGDIEGVPRALKGPLNTFAETISRRMRINELNRTKKLFVDAALNDPELRGMVRIVDKPPKGNYIDFFENQTRKYLEIGEGAEWLAQDAQLLSVIPGTDTLTAIQRWGRALNMPARYGATVASVPFIIANLFNDYLTAFMREGVTPWGVAKGWGRAVRSVFGEDEVVNAWRMAGSEVAGFFGKASDDIWRNLTKQGNYVVKNPRDMKRVVMDLLHTTEMASRIAVFERGGPMAALRSRRVTIDFDRAGDAMRVANAWWLFLNAGKEGFLLPFRSIRDNPKGTLSRLSAFVSLVGATYAWNTQFDSYKRVPDSIKYGQMVIMLPSNKYDNYGKEIPRYVVLVPNLREWSMFTAPVIYLAHKLEGKQTAGLKDTWQSWYPSWSPFSNILSTGGGVQVPTHIAQTISELQLNRDTFRNQPIVPDYLLEKPEVEQYDSRTSPLAITIGRAFGWSPMKVDYAINNVFASVGRDINYLISQIVRNADKELNDPEVQNYVTKLRSINEEYPPDKIESARVEFLNSLSPDMKDKVLTAERLPTDYIPIVSSVMSRFYKNYAMSAPTHIYLKDQEEKLGVEIAGQVFDTDDLSWRYDKKIEESGRASLKETELGEFYLTGLEYIERSDYYDLKDPEQRMKLRKSDPRLEAYMIFWGNLKVAENPNSMQWVREWMNKYNIPQSAVPMFQSTGPVPKKSIPIYPEAPKVQQPGNIKRYTAPAGGSTPGELGGAPEYMLPSLK